MAKIVKGRERHFEVMPVIETNYCRGRWMCRDFRDTGDDRLSDTAPHSSTTTFVHREIKKVVTFPSDIPSTIEVHGGATVGGSSSHSHEENVSH